MLTIKTMCTINIMKGDWVKLSGPGAKHHSFSTKMEHIHNHNFRIMYFKHVLNRNDVSVEMLQKGFNVYPTLLHLWDFDDLSTGNLPFGDHYASFLHKAIIKHPYCTDIIDWFCTHDFEAISCQDESGHTMAHLACVQGDVSRAVIQWLIIGNKDAPFMYDKVDGTLLLHQVVYKPNYIDTVAFLIWKNPTLLVKYHFLPVHSVLAYHSHEKNKTSMLIETTTAAAKVVYNYIEEKHFMSNKMLSMDLILKTLQFHDGKRHGMAYYDSIHFLVSPEDMSFLLEQAEVVHGIHGIISPILAKYVAIDSFF